MYSSKEALDSPQYNDIKKEKTIKYESQKKKSVLLVSLVFFVLGIGALTTTIVFLHTRHDNTESGTSQCEEIQNEQNEKVRELYKKIQKKYNEHHPDPLLKYNNGVSAIEELYFNFTPSVYKERTQTAKALLRELESLEKSLTLSKEENLTFELFRWFLANTFGTPYEHNYEIGDWLLGPNIYCWQKSCQVLPLLGVVLSEVKPKTVKDVEQMVRLIKKCSQGYKQRIENLKNGVLAGIVLSDDACRAGLQNFKGRHVEVAKKGANAILEDSSMVNLSSASNFQSITKEESLKWKKKYGNVSIIQYFRDSMVNNVGKSLEEFIRYLEDEYLQHCPPSNISSGFASLPLPYVYTNGVPDLSRPTTGRLPGGEKFSGKNAYLILLSHFTTYNITPEEVDKIADEKLKELFPQVVKMAKAWTKEENESKAIEKFRFHLEKDEFFYVVVNETRHSEPYLECYNVETAMKYCPQRWKTMSRWRDSAKLKVSELKKKVQSAFYVEGDKRILPTCKLKIEFDFSPANPYHSYKEGTADCSRLAVMNIPFFLERPGPKYEEVTVMAHESYPGHHLEVQGVKECFKTKCDTLRKWVENRSYFAAFSEGWATYIEKDVADLDMKMYDDDVIQKYGMLKHQILAALRAKVDVGLHYRGMKRQEALSLYEKYALDNSDGIQKEITRLQSGPGQGTAYMVGEAKFSEYRKKAKAKLGKKFDVRDFHFEQLRQGELPMLYLGKQVETYIRRRLTED